MKKIENLTVTCKYSVSMSGIEVPDDVYDALMENYELNPDDCRNTKEMNKAIDWLASHVHENDAFDWGYDIDDVE